MIVSIVPVSEFDHCTATGSTDPEPDTERCLNFSLSLYLLLGQPTTSVCLETIIKLSDGAGLIIDHFTSPLDQLLTHRWALINNGWAVPLWAPCLQALTNFCFMVAIEGF